MPNDDQFDLIDLDNLEKEVYTIGRMTSNIIDLLGLNIDENDIIIWKDRFSYIEKHQDEFENEEQYKKHVEAIPKVVQNPEYVGLHPNGNSIELIKKIDKNIMIAVRLTQKGKLTFRSLYPIKDFKLNNYIASGRVKRVNKD